MADSGKNCNNQTEDAATLEITARPSPTTVARNDRGTGYLGNPQRLLNLPAELLFMILEELDLEELYNACWTCKALLSFLMSKQAQRIWSIALKKTRPSLPMPPPSCSILAVARLLFWQRCHNCGCHDRSMKVKLEWFTRICNECIPLVSVGFEDAAKQVRDATSYPQLADILFKKDNDENLGNDNNPGNGVEGNRILLRDIDRMIEDFKAVEKPVSPEQFKAFLQCLARKHKERRRCAYTIDRWQNRKTAMIKTQRFRELISRLRSSTWEEEVEFLARVGELRKISGLPEVRPVLYQSLPLVTEDWEELSISIRSFLENTRSRRRLQEYRKVISGGLYVLKQAVETHYATARPGVPPALYRPSYIDFAFSADCRAIVDVPMTMSVNMDDFASIIPALATKWDEDVKARLTCLMRKLLEDIPISADVDPLTLAIAVFTCKHEHQYREIPARLRHYPAILSHGCTRTGSLPPDSDQYAQVAMNFQVADGYRCRRTRSRVEPQVQVPFDTANLDDGPRAKDNIRWMRDVVSALGLDPSRATLQDVEQCRERLHCRHCTDGPSQRPTFNWESAHEHHQKLRHEQNRDGGNLSLDPASPQETWERAEPVRPSWRQITYRGKLLDD
ncbi:hypothetical protein BD413DRAFT_155601 [Trametes elegans]|nr:hypothetical protein BD413DRAFT_155601 [Trametes elegans]